MRDLGGRISLTAVVTRDVCSRIIRAVKDCGADVDELWQNVNRTRGNVIMGDSSELILGERKPYNYCGLELYVHPNGFLQVNSGVAEKLYAKVSELASRANVDRIIDAYSGSGVLTAMLSGSAKEVIGVEIERAAVDSADELMRGNGIANVRNICGDCADVIPRLLSGGGTETKKAPKTAERSAVFGAFIGISLPNAPCPFSARAGRAACPRRSVPGGQRCRAATAAARR